MYKQGYIRTSSETYSTDKYKLIDSFETVLKEVAVDCQLFYHRNVYPSDEDKLKCKN